MIDKLLSGVWLMVVGLWLFFVVCGVHHFISKNW